MIISEDKFSLILPTCVKKILFYLIKSLYIRVNRMTPNIKCQKFQLLQLRNHLNRK